MKTRISTEIQSQTEDEVGPFTGPNLVSEKHSTLPHNDEASSTQPVELDLGASSVDQLGATASSHLQRKVNLPSRDTALFLFEVYFSRLYNATLLYHKQTLLLNYTNGKTPDFVSLAIFALASM